MKSALFIFSLFLVFTSPARASCDCNLTCSGVSDGGSCRSSCMATCSPDEPYVPPHIGYGAIAVSPSSMEYGYSYDYDSEDQAAQEALRQCIEEDCRVEVTFQDTCGALAMEKGGMLGKGDAWGTAWANNKRAAEKKAIDFCQEVDHTECEVEVSVCSN